MKTFTNQDLRGWGVCKEPGKFFSEDAKHTVLSILETKDGRIELEDKLWVIMRPDLVSEKLMRLFAVWCARQVQHLMNDTKGVRALVVAEAFATGGADIKELRAAWDATWATPRNIAKDIARDQVRSDAWWAARSAATAVGVTARDIVRDAARRAAWADTGVASWSRIKVAPWSIQEKKLKEVIVAGIKTGDVK